MVLEGDGASPSWFPRKCSSFQTTFPSCLVPCSISFNILPAGNLIGQGVLKHLLLNNEMILHILLVRVCGYKPKQLGTMTVFLSCHLAHNLQIQTVGEIQGSTESGAVCVCVWPKKGTQLYCAVLKFSKSGCECCGKCIEPRSHD